MNAEGQEETMIVRVPREKIIGMLTREASKCGLDLRRFYELGKNDQLDDPLLRDLWIIWSYNITEQDFAQELADVT